MLRWKIQKEGGRYIYIPKDDAAGTIIFTLEKRIATVFEGTRDYVDGICRGLEMSTGDKFTPEHIIHSQKPTENGSPGSKEVDDIYAGK